MNGIVTVFLLLSLRVMAQQPAQPSPPAASETSQSPQPAVTEPALQTSQPTQPTLTQPSSNGQAAPTTVDQVVDRLIEREHIVNTY
jgi:hypothetical protein